MGKINEKIITYVTDEIWSQIYLTYRNLSWFLIPFFS